MPSLSWSSDKVKKTEWEIAKNESRGKPDYYKVKRSQDGKDIEYENPSDPNGEKIVLTHSFVKFKNNLIVALDEKDNLLGKGLYASAKLAQDENDHIYVAKIQKAGNIKHRLITINENFITNDVTDIDYPPSDLNKTERSLMLYRGETLYTAANRMGSKERLDVFMDITYEFEKLHSGEASKSGNKYLHADIHNKNILIGDDNKVSIIDYGLAAQKHNQYLKGQTELGVFKFKEEPKLAPEISYSDDKSPHNIYSVQSDIYSIGFIGDDMQMADRKLSTAFMLMMSHNPNFRPNLNLIRSLCLVQKCHNQEEYNQLAQENNCNLTDYSIAASILNQLDDFQFATEFMEATNILIDNFDRNDLNNRDYQFLLDNPHVSSLICKCHKHRFNVAEMWKNILDDPIYIKVLENALTDPYKLPDIANYLSDDPDFEQAVLILCKHDIDYMRHLNELKDNPTLQKAIITADDYLVKRAELKFNFSFPKIKFNAYHRTKRGKTQTIELLNDLMSHRKISKTDVCNRLKIWADDGGPHIHSRIGSLYNSKLLSNDIDETFDQLNPNDRRRIKEQLHEDINTNQPSM